MSRASWSKQCWMLPSLNVSVTMVLAQQTADRVAAADSSFMFYLFKLSVCYISGNFLLNHQSLLRQQQTGGRGASTEFVSCWNPGSQLCHVHRGAGDKAPPFVRPTIQGLPTLRYSNVLIMVRFCKLLRMMILLNRHCRLTLL